MHRAVLARCPPGTDVVRGDTGYFGHGSEPVHPRKLVRFRTAIRVRVHGQHRQPGRETAQLESRHWIITDNEGEVQEVRGEGVVGAQPVLRPGEEFEYTSWCMIATPVGSMRGSYQMVTPDGDRFDAEIAPFKLSLPERLPN